MVNGERESSFWRQDDKLMSFLLSRGSGLNPTRGSLDISKVFVQSERRKYFRPIKFAPQVLVMERDS